LTDSNGNIYELKDVYNTAALSKAKTQQRPNAICVIINTPGTSAKFRFMGVPDAVYTINLTYQKASVSFAALADNWSPVPDAYSDIYNNLFLSEALSMVDDTRAQIYRQRGVAAFLSKAEGLTETQKNAFVQQWLARSIENSGAMMKLQQAVQGRGL